MNQNDRYLNAEAMIYLHRDIMVFCINIIHMKSGTKRKKANMSQAVQLNHDLQYLRKDKHLKEFVKLTPMAVQSRIGMQL
jgi:hypothetical protein